MKPIFALASIIILIHNPLIAKTEGIVKSYQIDVNFSPDQAFMSAAAEVKLDAGLTEDSIHFYLHGELFIDSLFVNNQSWKYDEESVFYRYDYSLIANKVSLVIPREDSVTVKAYYSGHFNPSKASSPSDYMKVSKDDGVLLRGYGYSLWFPTFCEDDGERYNADFNNISISVPTDYSAVFVGKKLRQSSNDKVNTSVWQAKNVDILQTQITARRFNVSSENNISVYCLQEDLSFQKAGSILQFAQNIVEFYQKNYVNKAALSDGFYIVEMPKYGNISSLNMVGISSDLWRQFEEKKWPKFVLAHELVHPFVQIEVSTKNEMYALVTEGFPSYFYLPVLEKELGKKWYDKFIHDTHSNYLYKKKHKTTTRGWSLPPEKPILDLTVTDIGRYKDLFILNDRVILFFDYLRKNMGEDKFQSFTKALFEKEQINTLSFSSLVLKYLPNQEQELEIWLKTNDYPKKFHPGD